MVKSLAIWLLCGLAVFVSARRSEAGDGEVAKLIADVKSVGREGEGNARAARASRELAKRGPDALVEVLSAIDDSEPIAANWLRAAVDTIAERTVKKGFSLPAAELEHFLLDRNRPGIARRLAYEWLTKVDSSAPDRLIPKMIDDPSVEMRRDAITRAMSEGEKLQQAGDRNAALAAYQKTFAASRDRDQVLEIAKRLEALEQTVDLTRHFGCLQRWHVIGPFDNTDKQGFDTAYPPEKRVDLEAEYSGKTARIRWMEHTTADKFGIVNLNKVIGKNMSAVAYATTEVHSDSERVAQLRVGSFNAVKIWLNGELLFTRDEYHHGMSMDQYVATGKLRPGRNQILIKICQNDQKDEWAQNWTFQARLCDLTGGGL